MIIFVSIYCLLLLTLRSYPIFAYEGRTLLCASKVRLFIYIRLYGFAKVKLKGYMYLLIFELYSFF